MQYLCQYCTSLFYLSLSIAETHTIIVFSQYRFDTVNVRCIKNIQRLIQIIIEVFRFNLKFPSKREKWNPKIPKMTK